MLPRSKLISRTGSNPRRRSTVRLPTPVWRVSRAPIYSKYLRTE